MTFLYLGIILIFTVIITIILVINYLSKIRRMRISGNTTYKRDVTYKYIIKYLLKDIPD